jgi:hypothetical protein
VLSSFERRPVRRQIATTGVRAAQLALECAAVANRKKTRKKRKPTRPLPKVGTPKDDAYRLEHSRHDLVDFGLTDSKRGPWNYVIVVLVIVLLVAGMIALILFT